MRFRPPAWLIYAFVFGSVAALSAFQPLARQTYIGHFMSAAAPPSPAEAASDAPASVDGLPVPRGLVWRDNTKALIERVGTITSAGALCLQIALWGVAAYALLRMLNPTFRLVADVDSPHPLLVRLYMHTPPLIKAFLIFTTAAVPLGVAWLALGAWLGPGPWSLGLRLVLTGVVVWVLFSHESVAGDYEDGAYELPRRRAALASLAARGAVAGLACAAVAAFWPTVDAGWLLSLYGSFGGLTEANWWRLVGIALGLSGAIGFGAGGILAALAPSGVLAGARIARMALPAAVLCGAVWLGRWGLPGLAAHRYDFPVADDGTEALARVVGVPLASSGTDYAVALTPFGPRRLRFERQSVTRLDAGPDAFRRVDRFVRRRNHTSALSGPAYVTLRDAAGLAWDTRAGLDIDLTRLTRCPDSRFVSDFVQTVAVVAADEHARRAVDALADTRRFTCTSTDAQTVVGDLYAALGNGAAASTWYRRAGVPDTQLADRLAERVRFVGGAVSGRLTLDGRPLAGARVGLVPAAAMRFVSRSTASDGRVLPFWLRWLTAAARTDGSGRFAFQHLPAGEYRLLISAAGLPPAPRGGPGAVFVGADRPSTDLGTVALVGSTPAR